MSGGLPTDREISKKVTHLVRYAKDLDKSRFVGVMWEPLCKSCPYPLTPEELWGKLISSTDTGGEERWVRMMDFEGVDTHGPILMRKFKRQPSYEEGLNQGWAKGRDCGYEEGLNQGWAAGRDCGYFEAYEEMEGSQMEMGSNWSNQGSGWGTSKAECDPSAALAPPWRRSNQSSWGKSEGESNQGWGKSEGNQSSGKSEGSGSGKGSKGKGSACGRPGPYSYAGARW